VPHGVSQTWWHIVVLRFLVALGVGGEWAVASAMVAEVFPPRARAWSGAIFTLERPGNVFGGRRWAFIVNNPSFGWRPDLRLERCPHFDAVDSDSASRAGNVGSDRSQHAQPQPPGDERFVFAEHRGRGRLWFTLAVIGLATFWGVHIYGKDLHCDVLAGL